MDSGQNLESIDTDTDIIVYLGFESKGILSSIEMQDVHKVKNIKRLQSPKSLQPKYIQILNITNIDSL